MKNKISKILSVFCCSVLLVPYTHLAAQQLTTTRITAKNNLEVSPVVVTTGSASFIYGSALGQTAVGLSSPSVSNYGTTAITPLSVSSRHLHKSILHSYGSWATGNTSGSGYGTAYYSAGGSSISASMPPMLRRRIKADEWDDYDDSQKYPPYNPPDMPNEGEVWQKTYNGAPLGNSLLPMLLGTVLFSVLTFIRRRKRA